MSTHKHVTIIIPSEDYNRIEPFIPAKRWGKNNVRDFWTKLFLQSLQSPYFLEKEKQRLSIQVEVATKAKKPVPLEAIDSITRALTEFEGIGQRPKPATVTPAPATGMRVAPTPHPTKPGPIH